MLFQKVHCYFDLIFVQLNVYQTIEIVKIIN